ncbi:histidine kinase [Chitinophaga horti]|uniref:Histidine kinase n=1 Tax=Chitinophaga horti TaxID=2920382 RepID=A0ABY6JBF1_9BACT|nr:ATP-binding protein [Chitinophaga horti]UYQ95717.1 histidine kinase [Chitinophaga horti]
MNPIRYSFFGTALTCLLLLLCIHTSMGQTKLLDSLQAAIDRYPQKDTVKVGLILKYVKAAVNENTTRLEPYLLEMIAISKAKNYRKGVRAGYGTAHLFYTDRGDLAKGMAYADSSFLLMEGDTSKENMIQKAYLHHNVASDYNKMRDYEMALYHYSEAAELLGKYQPQYIYRPYSGITEVYDHMNMREKVQEYEQKTIEAAERTGDSSAIAQRYLNRISRLINAKKLDKAEQYLKEVEPTVLKLDESLLLYQYYQNMGSVLYERKNFSKAYQYFQAAYEKALANDDMYLQVMVLYQLAESAIAGGKMPEAKQYLDTLLKKSVASDMKFGEQSAYKGLAAWHEKNGDHQTANEWLHKQLVLNDSIASQDVRDKLAMTEVRFKVRGKDNEIKMLQDEREIQRLSIRQKNTLNYILIGGAAALLIILLLGYRVYRNRQKLQQQRISELETEKQLTATEAVLKGEEQERTRLAKDLHDGLGGMLSGIKYSFQHMKGNLVMTPENLQAFERSMDMLDSSIKEMRRVAHNMMPEALVNYGLGAALNDFCNDISQSGAIQVSHQFIGLDKEKISDTTAITVFRIVQELLNNVLKHASAKTVMLQVAKNDNTLSVTVEDDGKGFDTATLDRSGGIGWSNIRNRVEFLRGTVDIQSVPNSGTSVLIEIPL